MCSSSRHAGETGTPWLKRESDRVSYNRHAKRGSVRGSSDMLYAIASAEMMAAAAAPPGSLVITVGAGQHIGHFKFWGSRGCDVCSPELEPGSTCSTGGGPSHQPKMVSDARLGRAKIRILDLLLLPTPSTSPPLSTSPSDLVGSFFPVPITFAPPRPHLHRCHLGIYLVCA